MNIGQNNIEEAQREDIENITKDQILIKALRDLSEAKVKSLKQ